jgi:hypothetical protein
MIRHDDPLFDPRLADWLEEDPFVAPDGALEVVLASIPSIKQRQASRLPWRNPEMTSPLRLGLAAAVVIAATAGGLYLLSPRSTPSVGTTPTSSPAVSASPSPAPSDAPSNPSGALPAANRTTFTSTQYGYTLEHPIPYRSVPATQAWEGDGSIGTEEPWVDRFFAPSGGAAFVGIAAQPVPAGTTAEAWMSAYEEQVAERGCSVPVANWTDSTVGDAPARRAEFDCGGTPAIELIWVDGDRGWVMTGEPAVIELMLESFTYE